jgi:hypothetical protein
VIWQWGFHEATMTPFIHLHSFFLILEHRYHNHRDASMHASKFLRNIRLFHSFIHILSSQFSRVLFKIFINIYYFI